MSCVPFLSRLTGRLLYNSAALQPSTFNKGIHLSLNIHCFHCLRSPSYALPECTGPGQSMSQEIRLKRSAGTKSSVCPENKKQCWEVTDNFGVDVNNQFHKVSPLTSGYTEDANSVSSGQTVSVAQNMEDNFSFVDDLEDSGVEMKMVADQVIVGRSGVPGFCLVQQCKSLPKPFFDHALTDTAVTKSQDDFDGQAVDKNTSNSKETKTCPEKSETVVTEFSKPDAEWEFDGKIVNKNTHGNTGTETISEKPQTDSLKPDVGLDTSCVAPEVCAPPLKLKDLTETPSQPAFCVCADNKDTLAVAKQEAASNKNQTLKTAGKKTLACVLSSSSGLKTNHVSTRAKEKLTKPKNTTVDDAIQKQGNSSKGLDRVSPRQRQTPLSDTKSRKRAQDGKDATCCHTASNSSVSKKKRCFPLKDSPKPVVSLSQNTKKAENVVSGDSRVSDTMKSKRTVLPAALLDGVVKTVQVNVRTISTQVVAASAEKPPDTLTNICATTETDISSNCTVKDPVSGNTVDKPVESAFVMDMAAGVTNSNSDGKLDGINKSSKGRQKDKRPKTTDKADGGKSKSRHSDDSVESSSSATVKQTKQKAIDGEMEKDLGCLAELPMKCVETGTSRAKLQKNKAKTKKSSAQIESDRSDYESENARLLSLLPVYIPENDGQLKPKKKSRKKRKSGCERNQASENASLLSILPAYIPENDIRLKKRKQDRVYNLSELFSGTLGEGQSREKRNRPNHFYAIQITSSVIKENLSTVLKKVEEAEPRLKPAFVPVETAHITLAVVHLADQEAIDRAKAGLDDFQSLQQQQQNEHQELQEQNQEEAEIPPVPADPLTLEVRGLGHFNDTVVFAKIAEGESLKLLQAIADSLRSCVLKQSIPLVDDFKAHLTIMKRSKDPKKLMRSGIKKISREVYKESSDQMFGTELVTSVQLCSMVKPKQNNYYYIEHSISLFDIPRSEGLTAVDGAEPVADDGKEFIVDKDKGQTANESKEPTADKGLTADDDRGPLTDDGKTLSVDDDKGPLRVEGTTLSIDDEEVDYKKETSDGKSLSVDDGKGTGDTKTFAIDEDKGPFTDDGKTLSTGDDKEL